MILACKDDRVMGLNGAIFYSMSAKIQVAFFPFLELELLLPHELELL